MSSLASLNDLPDISYFTEWEDVKQALQSWSVRDKFLYRTPCKDDRRARYVCTQPGCYFRVTGNRDRSGRITVKVVHREHTCKRLDLLAPDATTTANGAIDEQNHSENDTTQLENARPKERKQRNPAAQMKWLVSAVQQVLEVTVDTKPGDIQAAIKENFDQEIGYQQAFRCLRQLTADIKEQGHRERIPDEIRKAIVTLRVFVDPPMDWSEIERKTGVKARTAGYVFSSAEKKSGGSKDPFVLLKNATISTTGPKGDVKPPRHEDKYRDRPGSVVHGIFQEFPSSQAILSKNSLGQPVEEPQQPRKRRRIDKNIDPALDLIEESTQIATGDIGSTAKMPEPETVDVSTADATDVGDGDEPEVDQPDI